MGGKRWATKVLGVAVSLGIGQPEAYPPDLLLKARTPPLLLDESDETTVAAYRDHSGYQWAGFKIDDEWLRFRFELVASFGDEPNPLERINKHIKMFSGMSGDIAQPYIDQAAWLDPDGDGHFVPFAEIRNGKEIIRIEDVQIEGNRVSIGFPHYDSRIEAVMEDGALRGTWTKRRGANNIAEVEFQSFQPPRSGCPVQNVPSKELLGRTLDGRWSATFSESGRAVAEFRSISPGGFADPIVLGTFLTPTGDYRHLAGLAEWTETGWAMRLSTFDGAHAFLFKATLQPNGSLRGDFWSGNWWHETWTAERDDDATLPDAMQETAWRGDADLDELVFKGIDGNPRSVAHMLSILEASGGRATILLVFGSWCPNCADATEYLVELQQRYHARGLRVLGLAFELTGDIERDAKQVRIHQAHHGANWPVLIAGLSDKAKASQALPVLDKIRSYPTAVFMNSDRESVGVWTGFSGPATGEANAELRRRWEALIESLLDDE